MLVEERRTRLLELVRQKRFASLPELVEQIRVSESTIRRDLEHLEGLGAVKRIHGGVLYSGTSPKLPHFEQHGQGQLEKKRAVALQAVKLIDDGDTVLLGGGSTMYEVARRLVGRPIHVVTTSLPLANLFASDAKSDLVLIGGNICPRTGVAQGPLADEMIARLRVRRTMISVAAINEEGFFNSNLMLVETERAMMQAADEVIVVADSSKLGYQSMTHLCGLGDVQRVVVDAGMSDEWKERFRAAGVALTVAELNPPDVESSETTPDATPGRLFPNVASDHAADSAASRLNEKDAT